MRINLVYLYAFRLFFAFWGIRPTNADVGLFGWLSEWLGEGLQNLKQRFDSATNLLTRNNLCSYKFVLS